MNTYAPTEIIMDWPLLKNSFQSTAVVDLEMNFSISGNIDMILTKHLSSITYLDEWAASIQWKGSAVRWFDNQFL